MSVTSSPGKKNFYESSLPKVALTLSDVLGGDQKHLPANVDPHSVRIAITVEIARNGRVEAATLNAKVVIIVSSNCSLQPILWVATLVRSRGSGSTPQIG